MCESAEFKRRGPPLLLVAPSVWSGNVGLPPQPLSLRIHRRIDGQQWNEFISELVGGTVAIPFIEAGLVLAYCNLRIDQAVSNTYSYAPRNQPAAHE